MTKSGAVAPNYFLGNLAWFVDTAVQSKRGAARRRTGLFSWGRDWLGIPEDNATRVAQSVAIVRHMPMLVLGNGGAALVAMLAFFLTGGFTVLQLLPLLVIPWLLQVPLIRSWLRLRHAAPPATVSRRRIRLIVVYSAVIGLCWAGLILYYLPSTPFLLAAVLLAAVGFLCLAAVTVLSSMPLACVAYAVPMMLASIVVSLLSPDPTSGAVTFMLVLMMLGQLWFLRGNWMQFRYLVDLADEKVALLAQVEASSTAKSDFLAVVSHEVRTPLNGVIGMLGLALRTTLEPQQAQWLTLADRSARDLLAIVNDILDFSKLETGRLSIEPVDFHLGELVDSLATLFAPRAAAQGDQLNWTIDPGLPAWLRADDGRLRQVLLNLIGNAIKFTRDGRIDIRFAWMGGEESGMLQVEIVDTGSGIPPEKLGKLFQPFSQVDSSLSRAHDGTGLGLAICKRLVEALGGQIGVSSQAGAGSRFWFSIRCVPGTPQKREVGELVSAVRPLRILVAEDNVINQALMRELLHGGGHYCDLVADGVEAVEMVQKFPYDIVLMDVQMPRLDGVAATRQIRALDTRVRDIPIVALTANVLPSQRQSYLDAGMTYFIAKPVEAAALFRLLAAQATRL